MPRSGSGSAGSFSTGGGFSNPWGSGSGGGGVYTPSAPRPEAAPSRVGTAQIDITTPAGFVGSVQTGVNQGIDLIGDLGKALFGKDDWIDPATGERKGSLLGGIPVVGDLGRFVGANPISETIWKVPGAITQGIADFADSDMTRSARGPILDAQFNAVPDSAAKQAVLAEIEKNPGKSSHLKYWFLRDLSQEMQTSDPVLNPETRMFDLGNGDKAFLAPATLTDEAANLLSFLGWTGRAAGRVVSDAPRLQGGTRLDQIEALARGATLTGPFGTGFLAGPSKITTAEQIAYENWKAEVWTKDQALDFLTAAGAGISHDPMLDVAGTVALDPQVWGSLGASGLAKLGATGLKLGAAGEGTLLRAPGTSGRLNLLGKAAESERVNDFIRWYGGRVYQPLTESALGQAAKTARTIIDPFHAIGGNKVSSEAVVDIYSEAAIRASFDAYGTAGDSVLRWAHEVDPSLYEGIADGMSVYGANTGRRAAAVHTQRSALGASVEAAEALLGTVPEEALAASGGRVRAGNFIQTIREEAERVRELVWDDAGRRNLAERMVAMHGHRTVDEYLEAFAKMSDDELGFLHASTYGTATSQFLEAVAKAVPEYAGSVPLNRLVLLNKGTMTLQGAHGLLELLGEVPTADELALAGLKTQDDYRAAIILDFQRRYPELSYAAIREGPDRARSIERFESWLTERINKGVLPMQVTDDELAKMPIALRDFHDRTRGAWSLGFRPEDDLLSGLERGLEGELYAATVPWVDHVGTGFAKYRPASQVLLNVAGQPILGGVARRGAAALDYLTTGARILKGGVSSRAITENARGRFVKLGIKNHGLTDSEARAIFREIVERAQLNRTTARALSEQDMWEATRHMVPPRLRDTGKMTPRDVRNLLVEAYEGDLRFVGLTQKLTGRAKTVLAPLGGNIVGQVAEGLYPRIRFGKINAVFQAQERMEPLVLGSWRGLKVAWGTKMTEADRITQNILHKMAETDLIRMSDNDAQELSAAVLVGRDIEQGLAGIANPSWWEQLSNVAGAKRLNYLRTWQHKIGPTVKGAMDQHMPGMFDKIKAQMQAGSKVVISDDEVALRYIAEQSLANDFSVNAILKPGARAADMEVAWSREMWAPSNLGELKPLNLDRMAKITAIPVEGGKVLDNIKDLRAALADRKVSWERIEEALVHHNAHPDYIARVQRALEFHWDPFWSTVREKFNLSRKQVTQLQNQMAKAARMRGMTPVEFVSQVYSPYIEGGTDALIEDIGKSVNILRAPKGGGTPEMLVEELADMFASHLDPSGREMLLEAFERDLPGQINDLMVAGAADESRLLQTTLQELRGGWTKDATRSFAKAILDRMNGGSALPEPWRSGPYAAKTEQVLVSDLLPFREVDREVVPKFRGDTGYLDELTEQIKANGFTEPVILDYDPARGLALLGEGNHRLAVAQRLGLDSIPVRVVKTNLSKDAKAVRVGREPILKPDASGYFPADAKPSDIGLPVKAGPVVNVNVERAVQQFSAWARDVMADGLLKGEKTPYSEVLEKAAGLPTEAATPFNHTQQLMLDTITHALVAQEEDAFRLQYFSRNRSFLQRSINHPFFGIYPASYMWGKVAPELFRFIAKEPFGIRTGAVAYAFSDVQKSLAAQRAWDSKFDEQIEKVGHSEAVWFLGYMMPGLPWDVGAAAPQWMRDLAQQADENQARVDKGLPPKPIDLARPLGKIGDYVSPLRPALQVEGALDDLLTSDEEPTRPAAAQPAAAPRGPVQGAQIGSVLQDDLAPLREILTRVVGG